MPQSRIRRYLRHGTLPQLAVFEASARLASFTRAAEELHLAQPTVSAQIRKLTETIGAPLFEQVGKQIRLTEPGRCTYAHCVDVLAVFARLEESLGGLRDAARGELRLAIAGAATRFVARLIAGFGRCHPGLSVAVHIDNRAGLLTRLRGGEHDLFLFADPPQDAAIVRQAILDNPLVALAHPADPLVSERAIPLARIASAPFLMREPGSATRESVIDLFSAAGLVPEVRLALASDEAIRCAIAEGAGVSILPRDTFGQDHGLAVLDVVGLPLARHWSFAYPVGTHASGATQAFLRYARTAQSSGAQNAVGGREGP